MNIKNLVSAPSHLNIPCRNPLPSWKGSRKEGQEGRTGPGRWQWLPRAAALSPGCLLSALLPSTPFCGSAGLREFECSLCAVHRACHLLPHSDQSLLNFLSSFPSTCVEPAPQPGVPGRGEGHHGVHTHRENSRCRHGSQVVSHPSSALRSCGEDTQATERMSQPGPCGWLVLSPCQGTVEPAPFPAQGSPVWLSRGGSLQMRRQ